MSDKNKAYSAYFDALQEYPIKIGFLNFQIVLREACYLPSAPDTDFLNGTIGVEKSRSSKDRCAIAWQGIFEAIAYTHGIRDSRKEEEQTHSAANGLAMLLSENPHLVIALKKWANSFEIPEIAEIKGKPPVGIAVRIRNSRYRIMLLSALAGRYEQLFGSCDSTRGVRRILVTEDCPERFGLVILLHELVHAFQDCYGAGKEGLIPSCYFKAQAQGFLSFVQNNAEVFGWMAGRIKRPGSQTMGKVCLRCPGWN